MSLPCSSWSSQASASSAVTCSPVVRNSTHALSVSWRKASRFSSRAPRVQLGEQGRVRAQLRGIGHAEWGADRESQPIN